MNGGSSSLAARIGAAVGAEFLPQFFKDAPIPTDAAALFLPFMQAIVEFFAESVAGTDAAKQRSVLAGLFPPQDKSEPTSGPDADNMLIGRAASLFAALLRDFVLTKDPPQLPISGGLDEPTDPSTWLKKVERVFTARKQSNVFDAVKQSGLFDVLTTKAGIAAGIVYSQENVLRQLRKLARILDLELQCGSQIKDLLEAEIPRLVLRSLAAEVFAGVVEKLPFYIKSTTAIGNIVHAKLQDNYLRTLGSVHDIIVEKWDSRKGWKAELYVWFRGRKAAIPLSTVAKLPEANFDGFLAALLMAMVSPKLKEDSWLRADLVDLDLRQIWEIKPIASAVTAVWQEAFYRVGTNLILVALNCAGSFQPRLLESGGFWSSSTGVNLGRLIYVHPFIELYDGSPPLTAMPFQASVLDGIVLYAVFEFKSNKELRRLVRQLLQQAMRAAAQIAKALKQIIEDLQKIVDQIADLVLVACFVVLLIVAILLTLPEDALAGLALGIVEAGAALIDIVWPAVQEAMEAAPVPALDLRFGLITVRNVPSDRAGEFLTGVFKRLDDLGKNLTAKLQSIAPKAVA